MSAAICCILLSGGPVSASLEAPESKTVWDRLMEEQSSLNLRKGYNFMSYEQYPQAAEEFRKALEKNPGDARARVLYGASLYWLGEPRKALQEFDAVLKAEPENAMAFQLKGIVRAWQGDQEDALANFTRADAISKNQADVKMNIGSVYHSMGLYDRALDYSRQAVSLEPDSPLYRFQLGLLYSRLGRYDQAVPEMEKAISLFPAYEDAMLELAVLYDRLGRYEAAAKLYKKALVLKPGDSVARFRLAWNIMKNGGRSPFKRDGEIRNVLGGAFLLTPGNEKGGISITLAYSGARAAGASGNGAESGPGPAGDAQAGGSPLENAVAKVPQDEDIRIKVEILELPKTGLLRAGSETPGSLRDQLAGEYKRRRLSYTKKEYFLPAGKFPDRAEKAAAISEEIKEMMRGGASGNEARLFLNIETSKNAGTGGAAAAPKTGGVIYRPRDVGNDMGLWVIGDNWLENVSDALEEMDAFTPKTVPGFGVVRGLGYLLLGRSDEALAEFNGAGPENGAFPDLGRAAALVEKGDEAGALKACRSALEKEPSNKTAVSNIKWLSGGE